MLSVRALRCCGSAQLPAHEREVNELVDLEELTPKEAAQALGVSHVAVRKRCPGRGLG